MEVGKAKYGGGKKIFKIKDGDNVYRILPPIGKLAEAGRWSVYYRVEFGYKNSNDQQKPFVSPRVVGQNGMAEVESAAYLHRQKLESEKKQVMEKLKQDPNNKELKNKYKEYVDLTKRYNQDAKHYVNAVDLEGNIGLLKIGHKAMLALRSEIDKLRKRGIDPLSVEDGRFFNFHRSNPTGKFQDTTYQVTVYKERVEVNGEELEKEKVHKMDDSFIKRLDDEAFELSELFPAPTSDEVERIVKEGPTAVDEILGKSNSRSQSNNSNSSSSSSSTSSESSTEATSPSSSSSTESLSSEAATDDTTNEASGSGDTDTTSTVDTTSESSSGGSTTSEKDPADMDEEEFMKFIGADVDDSDKESASAN